MSQPRIGIEGAIEILQNLDPETRERIMGEIQAREPEVAAKIDAGLFTFEQLVTLDDLALQDLLMKEIPLERWAVALRACSEGVRTKLFSNLSKRRAEDLVEAIRQSGPKPLSEVRRIQQEIALIARRFAQNKTGV